MPYIKAEQREKFDGARDLGSKATNAGELNYLIFRIIVGYMVGKGLCYQTLNDIMGVLSGVDKELYRRITKYYEDSKIMDNGDVISSEEMRELSWS